MYIQFSLGILTDTGHYEGVGIDDNIKIKFKEIGWKSSKGIYLS
jgi:hypothetical protein